MLAIVNFTKLNNFVYLDDCKISKMSDKHRLFNLSDESPLYQLIVTMIIIVAVGFTILTILVFTGMLLFGDDLAVLTKSAAEISGNDAAFMRYMIIAQDISLFFIPSIIIMRMLRTEQGRWFSAFETPHLKEIGLVIILTFCVFPVTSFTGQLNAYMHLPSWMSGIERWMTEKEEYADNIIDALLITGTLKGLLINVIIIAIIPAISEEMIFRGVLQKIFSKLFRSGHLAIWITAILFSTIHFQFFGFIPRFILGLVFGYLFYWTGTLWLPILAHFVNNAFPLILAYVQGIEKFNEPHDVALWKQAIYLPLPIAVILLIMTYFRRNSPHFLKT